jgi:hypothetical protein
MQYERSMGDTRQKELIQNGLRDNCIAVGLCSLSLLAVRLR